MQLPELNLRNLPLYTSKISNMEGIDQLRIRTIKHSTNIMAWMLMMYLADIQ